MKFKFVYQLIIKPYGWYTGNSEKGLYSTRKKAFEAGKDYLEEHYLLGPISEVIEIKKIKVN